MTCISIPTCISNPTTNISVLFELQATPEASNWLRSSENWKVWLQNIWNAKDIYEHTQAKTCLSIWFCSSFIHISKVYLSKRRAQAFWSFGHLGRRRLGDEGGGRVMVDVLQGNFGLFCTCYPLILSFDHLKLPLPCIESGDLVPSSFYLQRKYLVGRCS